MSLRMVFSSSDGLKLFPESKPHDFRVQLNRAINLDGYWVVSLTELSIEDFKTQIGKKELYIYCDVCSESFTGETEQPLLRRIYLENDNIIFDNPYYILVKRNDISQLHVYIKDGDGNNALFLKTK